MIIGSSLVYLRKIYLLLNIGLGTEIFEIICFIIFIKFQKIMKCGIFTHQRNM